MKHEILYFIIILIILLYFNYSKKCKKNRDNFTFPEQPRITKSYNTSFVDEVCNKSCGGGMRYRNVYCETVDGTVVDNKFCLESKPSSEESCNEDPCDQWTVGDWTECSEECGEGIQTRDVWCEDGNVCDEDDIPPSEQVCTGTNCYNWEFPVDSEQGWGQCLDINGEETPCNGGTQSRTEICINSTGDIITNIDDAISVCGREPIVEYRSCNEDPCDQWTVGDWTECSEECGEGIQTRDVWCEDGNVCDEDDIPPSEQVCTGTNCYNWEFPVDSEQGWGQCLDINGEETPCNGGTQSRTEICINSAGDIITNIDDAISVCGREPIVEYRSCNEDPCNWETSDWRESINDDVVVDDVVVDDVVVDDVVVDDVYNSVCNEGYSENLSQIILGRKGYTGTWMSNRYVDMDTLQKIVSDDGKEVEFSGKIMLPETSTNEEYGYVIFKQIEDAIEVTFKIWLISSTSEKFISVDGEEGFTYIIDNAYISNGNICLNPGQYSWNAYEQIDIDGNVINFTVNSIEIV